MKRTAPVAVAWILASCIFLAAAIRGESIQAIESSTTPVSKPEGKTLATRKTVSAGIADLLNMAERGVDASILKSFAESYPVAYHPTSDEVIALHEAGISSETITALLRRTAELRSEQLEANTRALAQRSEVRKPATASITQNSVPTVAPQQTVSAPQVNYVYSYAYPAYPTYSYSYSLPFYYGASYCHRPYGYSYWPRSYCWPSWRSYGVNVGFRSGYCARPAFGFRSYPHSSRFVCR